MLMQASTAAFVLATLTGSRGLILLTLLALVTSFYIGN